MQAGFLAEHSVGYFQSAAVDAATTLASILGAQVMSRGIVRVIIQPQTQAVRWRDDGTPPTATIGQPLAVGAELNYTARDLANLQFISQTAGAILNIVAYSSQKDGG